jgi:hypothetical protein
MNVKKWWEWITSQYWPHIVWCMVASISVVQSAVGVVHCFPYSITSAVMFQLGPCATLHLPWHVFFLQGERSQFPVTLVSSVSWLLCDWAPPERGTSDGLWLYPTTCLFCGDPAQVHSCRDGVNIETFRTAIHVAIKCLYLFRSVNVVWYLAMLLLREVFSFVERQTLLLTVLWLYACSLCAT